MIRLVLQLHQIVSSLNASLYWPKCILSSEVSDKDRINALCISKRNIYGNFFPCIFNRLIISIVYGSTGSIFRLDTISLALIPHATAANTVCRFGNQCQLTSLIELWRRNTYDYKQMSILNYSYYLKSDYCQGI